MEAAKDKNRVSTLLGVSSADYITPIPVAVDPVTHRLLVNSTGSGGSDYWDRTGTVLSPVNAGDDIDLGLGDITATDAHFTGKLTVDGLIDPTGLLLTPQAVAPGTDDGMIYYDSGDTKFYFRESGSWVALGAGGTPPGGLNTQIQFNNSGSFGGSANLTWNGSTLGITGNITSSTSMTLGAASGTTGSLIFKGTTSGTVTLTVADAAGTYSLVLPTTAGTANQFLQTDGSGNLTWAAAGGGTPSAITVANEATDTSCFIGFFTAATGDLGPKTNAGLTFNSATGVLTATGFSGPLTGDVTGNCSGSSGSCTGNSASATYAGALTIVNDAATTDPVYLTWVLANTGNIAQYTTSAKLSFVPSTGVLTATAFAGNLTGNVTGNVSGSSGSCTGNAANVTGTVAIGNGGTGETTANAALNALLPSQGSNNGKFLQTDGTNTSWVSGTAASLQACFDVGQAITIADTDNQTLALTNNDVTNNQNTFNITNATTGTGLYINQSGVLDSNKRALYIYSNAAQVTSSLAEISLANASSDKGALFVSNAGTGYAATFTSTNLDDAGFAVYINQGLSTSTGSAAKILQQGRGIGLEVHRTAVPTGDKSLVYVYSNAATTRDLAPLLYIYMDNASATSPLQISENKGTNDSLRIIQTGVLAASCAALNVYSSVAQDTSGLGLVSFALTSSSATIPTLGVQNDGTGNGITTYRSQAGSHIGIVDAAATGDTIGIEFTMGVTSGGCFAFKFSGDEHDTSSHGATAAGRIKVKDGATTKYIYMYSD